MNKNIKTCPNCGAHEIKGGYHSLFGCGSYYSDMRGGTPTITEKREGYIFHETLQCAHNRIATLNIRLFKVEEYVKKQTEVPKKSLKSLEEHNKQAYINFAAVNNLNSGFACPKCGEEMYYSALNSTLLTYPPKRIVNCYKCNYTDHAY
jgi:DNA-directed RNA polymerase subunit M/transcription elongation factor TFIIS